MSSDRPTLPAACFMGCSTALTGLGAGGAGGPDIGHIRWCGNHRDEGLAEVERRRTAAR